MTSYLSVYISIEAIIAATLTGTESTAVSLVIIR